jgi:hypothetical protein
MNTRFAFIFLSAFLASCATTSAAGSGRSARVLTAEEIAEVPAQSAYQVVEMLRPQWLHMRSSPTWGSPEGAQPMVYVDGIRAGDLGELLRIVPSVVERMEYLSPSDATNRFGTDHMGGAILVTTR